MTLRGHALTVRAFGATHTGRVRAGNEDSFLIGDAVFAVADGMGGHQAGEIASDAALEPLRELDVLDVTDPAAIGDVLATAVREANAVVVERAAKDPQLQGMGTTLTAVAVREGQLHVAHVGDSRAYLLRDKEAMSQLTTDHTLVERLVREGRLSRDEASTHPQRNVITRAIGHEATVDIEVLPPITLRDGDQILLCSDGLSGPVPDDRIAAILTGTADGERAVAALLAQANAAGGPDNITAVLVRVGERWAAAASETADADPGADPGATQQIAPRSDGDAADSGDDRRAASDRTTDQLSVDALPPATDESATPPVDDAEEAEEEPQRRERRIGAGRILVALLAVTVIAGIVAAGGWLLLSRSYFVGEHQGMVAIFRGVPQQIVGVSAAQVIPEEITTTPVSQFPDFRQQAIRDGLSAQSLDDARRIVADLQAQLRDSQPSSEVGEPLIEPSPGP